MNRSYLQSALVLLAGVAIVAAPVFAFAHNDDANAPDPADATTVSIADNGAVLVRGAEVAARTGDVLTVRTEWGDTSLTWVLDTDNGTDVLREKGGDADFDDVSIGDTVSFSGRLETDASSLRVDVDTLRDWSLDDEKPAPAHGKAVGIWKQLSDRFPGLGFFAHAKAGKDHR